jgi:hypothetical protein
MDFSRFTTSGDRGIRSRLVAMCASTLYAIKESCGINLLNAPYWLTNLPVNPAARGRRTRCVEA